MKVEVKECSKKAERPFPKLMININNGVTVALFCAPREGTILQSMAGNNPVGFHARSFESSDFEDFEGEITLSND